MKQNNMLAMILAGGRGTRLHDLTNKTRCFLWRQVPDHRFSAEQLCKQRH